MLRLALVIHTFILFSFQTVNAQSPSYTTGLATVIHEDLIDCGNRSRISAVGRITSDDGKVWTVPAETNFTTAEKAADMFNQCGGTQYSSSSDIDIDAVPVYNAGGNEEFIAYIFADNYFELYVNGKLLAVDPVPFTPFNSNVIRFKASRPLTLAVKMVDWEENLGVGSEKNRGSNYHPGDGGLVAHIKSLNGQTIAITDASWQAQTFYTAPLSSRDCLVIDAAVRDSSACSVVAVDDGRTLSAAHWMIPENWAAPSYDASAWPGAHTFTNNTVGVDNKKAYTNFADIFDDKNADAQFIWSSNLILDNVVLLRKTIE